MIGALVVALVVASPKPYDPSSPRDMITLGARLRAHVAALTAKLPVDRSQPLLDTEREGYGVVWGPTTLVCLAHIVEGAERVEVVGPKGRLFAKVALFDLERRVALLEAERPLVTVGLVAPERAPAESRKLDAIVFALTGVQDDAYVVFGQVVDDGTQDELEGHPRSSLRMQLGMPIFDAHARLLGYAHAVSWDKDRSLIVTPEHVLAAKTATAAAPRASPQRPWWAK